MPFNLVLNLSISELLSSGDLHIRNFVARNVEVVACCLSKMLVGNIPFMFRKSFLRGPVTFSNVLRQAKVTLNALNCCCLHYFYSLNKRANWAVIAWNHSSLVCLELYGRNFTSYQFVSDVAWPLVGKKRRKREHLSQMGIRVHSYPMFFSLTILDLDGSLGSNEITNTCQSKKI